MRTNLCSKCQSPKELGSKRYCRSCSNSYMREWRKTHKLKGYQVLKATVRRKTNYMIKRGMLIKQPCELCGDLKVEAHHDDYSQPYNVRWLCFGCHRGYHNSTDSSHT